MTDFNLNLPWESLDSWQKEYIETPVEQDCFLLTPRQAGKTTAMSIKSVEKCIHEMKKGEAILIASLTEKQGYLMLARALAYAHAKYPTYISKKRDEKPTMHRVQFTNGTAILCYAAGETGEGLRGYTIKKLLVDEGSRMTEEFFIAVLPMLSVTHGSLDIASTPCGKKHPDGTEKFFYKCSKDENYKKFLVNLRDCPRHPLEFLEKQKGMMSKFHYAQEYEAVFTDELLRLFSDDLIKKVCCLKRIPMHKGKFFLGSDIAGYGDDECTFEIVEQMPGDIIQQRESIIEKRNKTTDTSRKIIELNKIWKEIKKIAIDDGGIGFGVYSELMDHEETKNKTLALNNASRPTDQEGEKSKKLLKEEMYFNLLTKMENEKIQLLDDDEIKASLSSTQFEEGKVFSSYGHLVEGIIRAVWECSKDKSLNIISHTF